MYTGPISKREGLRRRMSFRRLPHVNLASLKGLELMLTGLRLRSFGISDRHHSAT